VLRGRYRDDARWRVIAPQPELKLARRIRDDREAAFERNIRIGFLRATYNPKITADEARDHD